MNRRVLSLIMCLSLGLLELLSVSVSEAKQKELLTFEPIFGIAYYSSKVNFEPAPEEIFNCQSLRQPKRKLWVLGKTKNNGKSFIYLYGLVEVDFGAGPTGDFEAQNDDGIIVILSPAGCRDIGADTILTTEEKYRRKGAELGITDDVVAELFTDVIAREVKAFGGVTKFLDKVKAAGIDESLLHPQLRLKLQELRKRGRTSGGK